MFIFIKVVIKVVIPGIKSKLARFHDSFFNILFLYKDVRTYHKYKVDALQRIRMPNLC